MTPPSIPLQPTHPNTLTGSSAQPELTTADIEPMARAARAASRVLATVPTTVKDAVLLALAALLQQSKPAILIANAADCDQARAEGLAPAKLQRLALTDGAVDQLAEQLRAVAALPDPVGQTTAQWRGPSGIDVKKIRCPLGVIAMIYEARPGVTIDAFALCFKAGNAAILKGGKEAARSNRLLASLAHRALADHGLPAAALTAITTTDRAALLELLKQREHIDLVIPRGGEDLIRWVAQHSTIPTIQHYKGVCHAYIDADADLDMALRLCVSGKTTAPATCNALECVLVHQAVAERFIPALLSALAAGGVQTRACPQTLRLALAARLDTSPAHLVLASPDDFGREFLDLTIAVKLVASLDEAVAHIDRYGSSHTESIITQSRLAADEFLTRVQASCTLHNASTRMNDGHALGLGAEIGISTTRLHAYGVMGLQELTAQRYVAIGTGQSR